MPEGIRAYTVDQLIAEWQSAGNAAGRRKTGPLNIVGVGAHPDDPETGCGGTLAQFAAKGHNVHLLYLTRGEYGRKDLTAEDTALVRAAEAAQACNILQATPHFVGQIDGRTVVDPEHARKFTQMLLALNPDIVFTQWPLDTHADHRNASQLTQEAWEASNRKFMLVQYEVMPDIQTQNFKPNLIIDIGNAVTVKHDAIFCHASQNRALYDAYHANVESQHGQAAGFSRAEAFHVVSQNTPKPLRPAEVAVRPVAEVAEQLTA